MKQPDRSIVYALDDFMIENGFKFIKSRNFYVRRHRGGFDKFSWGTYPLSTGKKWVNGYYEGHYGIGKRNDAIEEIYNVLDLTYGEDNKRYRSTVYRAVGNIGGYFAFNSTRDHELCLRFDNLEEDILSTSVRIKEMLGENGFQWYEQYADAVALSRDINDPIGLLAGPHPLVNNIDLRPLAGIAAACVGEPEKVGELVDGYLIEARKLDERCAGQRKESFALKLEKQSEMMVNKARELGYAIHVR